MELHARPLNLTLRHTFTLSRASMAQAQNVLVELRWGRLRGAGEAAPSKYYGQTQASVLRALGRMSRYLHGRTPYDLEDVLGELRRHFPKESSAVCAVDLALHDLMGQHLKMPLWKLWGLNPGRAPQTSFTIGIDTLEKIAAKVAEAAPYPILKIKAGVPQDLDILREVRRLAPRKTLRVDANCGWTVKEAIQKARVLEKLGVEFIEQPVPPGRNAALKRIRNATGLPLFADESSCTAEDIPALRGCADGINIKLVKCGGLRQALKMIHTARACGLKVMLGCMIESSVLITAASHLAPLADFADLDGNLLVTNDPFRGTHTDRTARLVLPNAPGLGVRKPQVKI